VAPRFLRPWHLITVSASVLIALGGLIVLMLALRRGAGPETVALPEAALQEAETLAVAPLTEPFAPVAGKPPAAELLPAPLVEKPRPPAGLVRAELLPPPEAERPPMVRGAAVLFKRRDRSTEEQLRGNLAKVPEVGLGNRAQAVYDAYQAAGSLADKMDVGGVRATTLASLPSFAPLLQVRPDLGTLPLRSGARSGLGPQAAASLKYHSQKLHLYLEIVARLGPDNRDKALGLLRQALEQERLGRRPEWLCPEAVPALTQLLMSEDARGRRLLVDLLARIPGRKATETLARRAVFDLDAGIREAAIEALRGRWSDPARPVLLAGLRHVWAPAADHAAEALVALRDRAAVPGLIDLLEQPDPAAPQKRGKRTVVSELVRLNHLSNCLVCHPSGGPGSRVSADIPGVWYLTNCEIPGKVGLPGPTPRSRYYPAWARADITFLRQDFSVQLPVTIQGLQKAVALPLRFDYVVRTRQLSEEETRELRTQPREPRAYPQREAVLFALRELTGEDPGPGTLAWRRLFPQARLDLQVGKLVDALSTANPKQRDYLLEQYQASTWPLHTRVLGWAVYRLHEAAREQARTALDRRLARLSPAELRAALRHDLPEVRESAIRVCLGHKDLVPALIPLLEDSEALVAWQAREVLVELTDQSFKRSSEWLVWWHRKEVAVAAR
jgi:HEAT repeat protein